MNLILNPRHSLVFFLVLTGVLVLTLSASCNSKQTEPVTTTSPPGQTVTEQAVQYPVETAVSPDGGGAISVPGSGKYTSGAVIEITAVSAAGYRFDHWQGDASGTVSIVSLTMDSARNVTAVFTQQFPIKVSVEPAGAGTVNLNGDQFDAGSNVTLSAAAAEGYRFDKWSGANENQESELKITVDGPKDLTAHFIKQHKLSITIDPPGAGWVTPPAGNYDTNAGINLKASPNTDYMFDRLEGVPSGSDNTTSFLMDGDKSIVVHFIKSRLNMFEAVDKKLIIVSFEGTNFLNILNIKLTSKTDKPYTVTLPVGTILAASESRIQPMAVTYPFEYPLETIRRDGTATAKVYVFAIAMGKDVANVSQTLFLSPEKLTGDLKTLIEYPFLMSSYSSVGQYAVWTITENPPERYGYWPINSNYPTVEQIKTIRDLFKAAGIPVENYRVFEKVLGTE
jgi:hypothetical protein